MTAQSAMHRKLACLLGVASFLSFIYFYEGGGWNQNSRFDLLRAMAERHTLQIDAYHENTRDLAHSGEHFYSDKAPGVSFLAFPFAVAARAGMRAGGIDPNSPRGEYALSYIVTAFTVALPTALAVVCLFFLSLRLGSDAAGAIFAAAVMAIATPYFAYANLFWAHALVGSCLLFGFAAALKIGDGGSDFRWALAVGLAAGWATVTEYPAAPVSALLALFALARAWWRGVAARRSVVAGVALGATACAVVLFSYLHAAFGSFRPSYSYYDPSSFSWMHQHGYLGLTYPHPDRLLKILFQCRRGLFFGSPVLLSAVVGLWWMRKDFRVPALVAAAIVIYYFLFNASFFEWKAGMTFGPRYAGASFPLLYLGLGVAWTRASTTWRYVLLLLAACSVFFAVMVISTSSQLSMVDNCPMFHSAWPMFRSGQMAVNRMSMLTASEAQGGYAAFNLGQLIGLHGLPSVAPLIAIWGVAGTALARILQSNHKKIVVSR